MKTHHIVPCWLLAVLLSGCVTTGSGPGSIRSSLPSNDQLNQAVDTFVPDNGYKQAVKGTLQATREWTPEEERTMGANMSAVLLGASPLVKNVQVEKYLNEVGHWVALQSPQPDIPWRFGMLDTPNLNAFAAPGGYIFITRGLFLRLKSEAELAGVLAHEITHVIQRHHIKAMRKQGFSDIGFGLLQQKTGSAEIAAFNNVAKGLFISGLDKADELEADRMGVLLAARAGYSPYGLPSVLQMYAASPHDKDSGLELLFATHPDPNVRLEQLQVVLDDRSAPSSGMLDTPRLKKMQQLLENPTPKVESPKPKARTKKKS